MFKYTLCHSKILHTLGLLLVCLVGLAQTHPSLAAEPARQTEAEWLVMLYQVADDQTLEEDILFDLNEAEFIGSSDQVHIVAQVDRFIGSFDGMDDWTSTKRFYLTADPDFETINSQELEDLGEVNMADAQTLMDFMFWAMQNFPARKYALIMSDHGMGWPGGFSDPDPGTLGSHDIVLASGFGDALWLMEIDQALEQVRASIGLDQLEFIGFDVCLMGSIEVFTAMAAHARYAAASEELEPGVGWAYAAVLDQLINNPGMDGAELAQAIVDAYIDQDVKVQMPAEEAGLSDITLAAVDLSQMANLHIALDNFVFDLLQLDQNLVAEARAYAQPSNSPIVGMVDENLPSSYIDLGHFAQLMQDLSPEVAASASDLLSAIQAAVIAEKHGSDRPGSTGMTIEFPVIDQYGAGENLGYALVAHRFAEATQWDEFLFAHHTGGGGDFSRPDQPPQVEAPQAEELVEIPGITSQEDFDLLVEHVDLLLAEGFVGQEALDIMEFDLGWPSETVTFLAEMGVFEDASRGASRSRSAAKISKPIEVTPLILSAEVVTPDQPVVIQTEISGDQLGYVYSFIGRFLPREDVLIIEDMDYIFADDNKEVGGVTRPLWPEDGFSLDYEWPPTIFAMSDGQNSVRALFEPETYGDSPTYKVKGLYTFADSGSTRPAWISFRQGELSQVFVFSGPSETTGAPREVTPTPGDTFTILERGFDLNAETDEENFSREGGRLTFGTEKFFIEETPAPSGNYVVGIIAEDLQGNRYEQYEGLFVVSEDTSAVDGFLPYVNEELELALLYPESWLVTEDPAESTVDFVDEQTGTVLLIARDSYPEATTTAQANDLAIQDFITEIEADGELQNLQFVTEEAEDYVLGAFDGKIFEFTFELEGQPFYAAAVVASPTLDITFGLIVLAPDENFDAVVDDVEALFASFDVLISGLSKEPVGPPPPAMAEVLFSDDFSDPTSGLVQNEAEQDWGRGFYDPAGQYVFELKPNPGAIYDFYLEQSLPEPFVLQVTASYAGAANNGYGLIFQLQPAQTETETDQFYTFRISGDGFYSVEQVGQETKPLIDWTYTEQIDQAENATNVLTVEGTADGYNLYINHHLVDSFSGELPGGGGFGLIVDNYDTEAPVTFTFDDLTLGPPAP
jgi:hypothetical protein